MADNHNISSEASTNYHSIHDELANKMNPEPKQLPPINVVIHSDMSTSNPENNDSGAQCTLEHVSPTVVFDVNDVVFRTHQTNCNRISIVILLYYMLTLLAGQPLLTYVLGMITGICGFFGSRSPFNTHHFKMMYLFNLLNHTMVFFGFLLCLDPIVNDSSETQMLDGWIGISSAKARMVICILLGVSNILLHIVSIRISKPFRNYLISGFIR